MKKFKKFFCLALSAVLVLGTLAACGGSETGGGGSGGSGSNSGKWKIGGIGPLTGGAASYGISVQRGAQIAVDEINAAGGINGVQVEFTMQDDQADDVLSVNAYNSLKDWGMQILMGTVTSGAGATVVPLSSADNMFQLTPSASSEAIINGNTNVFQVCFIDPNQGIGAAQYIGQTGVYTISGEMVSRVAVIYDSSDIYSTGIYTKFAEEAANQPFEIVATESFTADSKSDFSVQLQKARDAGAQLVFLPIYYNEAALILNQADAMNSMYIEPLIFFGCDGLDGILGVPNFDTSLAEGVILITPFAADSPDAKVQAFVAEYQNRHGETPDQFAADGYDAIYIIKAAIEKSGATPSMSISEIGTALTSGITSLSYNGLTGNNMTWAATGEVNKGTLAVIIKNGVYTSLQ
jgi:branched-chain amino acid transport system substrate-binding protein